MKSPVIFYLIIFIILFIFAGCEGPEGPQGEQGPSGISIIWVEGFIQANSFINPQGTSNIFVYNTSTIPNVTLNSMEYNYNGYFHLDFEPLNPGDEVNITIDGINLDGDSIYTYTNLIVPGPIDFYNESSNDTIYITLGNDVRLIWNNADNSTRYECFIYVYYYYTDTSDTNHSYSFTVDTTLNDTSLTISANSICPNLDEISSLITTSGYCWVSASNGPFYTGDTNNVYGDGAGFIYITYYSIQYNIRTLLNTNKLRI